MDLKSGYFVGSLILGIPYFLIFLVRKDLRREMLFGGTLLLPFALLAPFYIPEYWDPPYLFDYIYPFKVGIEDFIFCFFVGGISAVIFEFITKRKEVKIRKIKSGINWWPYLFVVFLLLVGEHFFPNRSIITLTLTGIVAASIGILKRGDLLWQSIFAGVLFTAFYFLFFKLFSFLYPSYIDLVYQHNNLFGIYVAGIPVEELLFAFSTGASWSIFYEFTFSYKTVKK